MNSGRLVHVIQLQRRADAIGAAGDAVTTWAKLADMRAEILRDTGAEAIRGGGGVAETQTQVFRIRWIDGVTLADRVEFRGLPWNIRGIAEIGRRHRLELTCEAGP